MLPLQEADLGDGRDVHPPLARAVEELVPALYIMTSHSNGMSALQLLHHLGLGSYKSAWMLAHKIRRAMVVADGFSLVANVQADETGIPYCLKGSEPPLGGRSPLTGEFYFGAFGEF